MKTSLNSLSFSGLKYSVAATLLFGVLTLAACNDDDNIGGSGHKDKNTIVSRLDSTISQSNTYYGKTVYTYNEKGLVDTLFVITDMHSRSEFEPSLNFYDSYAEVYTYDANDSLIMTYTFPIESKGISHDSYKTIYIRNDKGQKISQFISNTNDENYEWYGGNTWEYTYDASGRLVNSLNYYQYINRGTKELRNKIEYTYDNKNNPLTEVALQWSFYYEDWTLNYSYEYTYNKSNQLVQSDEKSGSSSRITRIVYAYDANGNTSMENYYSSYNGEDWENYGQNIFEYDSFGHLVSITQYRNFYGAGMQDFFKSEFTYDAYGNEIESISYTPSYNGEWTLLQTNKSYYSIIGDK